MELEVEVCEVDEVVQILAPSSSPPPLWHPFVAATGRAAFEVLTPTASDMTNIANTIPIAMVVAFVVFCLLEVEDPVNMILEYRSEIYIIILIDFEKSITPKQSIY